jgi:hypothetical protein
MLMLMCRVRSRNRAFLPTILLNHALTPTPHIHMAAQCETCDQEVCEGRQCYICEAEYACKSFHTVRFLDKPHKPASRHNAERVCIACYEGLKTHRIKTFGGCYGYSGVYHVISQDDVLEQQPYCNYQVGDEVFLPAYWYDHTTYDVLIPEADIDSDSNDSRYYYLWPHRSYHD